MSVESVRAEVLQHGCCEHDLPPMKHLRALLDERTVVGLCGLGLLAAGCAFVYLPLALIVPGVALFGVAVLPKKG